MATTNHILFAVFGLCLLGCESEAGKARLAANAEEANRVQRCADLEGTFNARTQYAARMEEVGTAGYDTAVSSMILEISPKVITDHCNFGLAYDPTEVQANLRVLAADRMEAMGSVKGPAEQRKIALQFYESAFNSSGDPQNSWSAGYRTLLTREYSAPPAQSRSWRGPEPARSGDRLLSELEGGLFCHGEGRERPRRRRARSDSQGAGSAAGSERCRTERDDEVHW